MKLSPLEVDRELYADKTFPAGNIRMFPAPREVDRELYKQAHDDAVKAYNNMFPASREVNRYL